MFLSEPSSVIRTECPPICDGEEEMAARSERFEGLFRAV